jgi:lipopolysaccharide biosynthesis glycosyltransferase
MHIAVSIDEAYVTPLCGMLSSLLLHNRDGAVHIHVLSESLPESAHLQLGRLIRAGNATYCPHDVDADRFRILPLLQPNHALPTFFRLVLPELLPDVDRVLYLDVDLLIRRPLTALYAVELAGHAVAAVSDVWPEKDCARVGIPAEWGYFNAGVLVMDLRAWRDAGIAERALEHLIRHRETPERCLYADQDGLNAAMKGAWLPLPETWNFFMCYADRNPALLPRHIYEQLHAGPSIVHFAARKKPWLRLFAMPFQDEFLRHARDNGIHYPRGWGFRDIWQRFSELRRLYRLRRCYRRAGVHVTSVF